MIFNVLPLCTMSENSKDFIDWVSQVESANANLSKLSKEEQEKVLAEEKLLLTKMESCVPSFDEPVNG